MSLNNATVRLVTGSKITAKVKSDNGQIDTTSNVTLKNTSVGGGGGVSRLDQLADVVESAPQEGFTLVYQELDDKYVVKQLSLDQVSGSLDGGTF